MSIIFECPVAGLRLSLRRIRHDALRTRANSCPDKS
jgi:hypothetical protein